HGGLTHFGYGSWTDMRDFVSTAQSDTFLVTFAPGYDFGGNYPMTIQWALSDIRNAFPSVSPVLTDPHGNRVSMWTGSGDTARIIITDSTISYLYITTQSPNFPAGAARQWNLVSIPQNILNDYINNIFMTADSPAFAYVTGTGYIVQDTLLTGKGYWVHYSPFIDSLKPVPLARLQDTMTILSGWNMFGSLSSPVAVNAIKTVPSGCISSEFFAYNKGYSIVDTLLPTKGYWVKASQTAEMVVSTLGIVTVRQTGVGNDILGTSNTLLFGDIAGNVERLYCRAVSASDKNNVADLFEAPPLPPEGVFDVRFSSNRILETVVEQQTSTFPVIIQGAEYPITVSWQANTNSVSASIVIDGKEVPLNGTTGVQIVSPGSRVSLELLGMPAVPSTFALEQNYPNPFNPTTTLKYALPTDSKVTLKVYNVLGQVVATLVNGVVGTGYQFAQWNANTVASGIYFYRIDATSLSSTSKTFTQVKKMVLVK
ncbi:MAG TPA: T9SS type A sorting domain-containing protein, partial [Bacteroidota bacterium]|nr:T9SS type A sorting domain-containing protein [Bacteroidota bacterium]